MQSFAVAAFRAALMNHVDLEARHWRSSADFYKALLQGLGAPDWHGDRVSALVDSMFHTDINRIVLPLRVTVTGLDQADRNACDELIKAFTVLTGYGALARITAEHAVLKIGKGAPRSLSGQD